MRVHGARAVEAGARAGAAAQRLVVLVARVAEREVVHRALRAGARVERGEQRVGDALRRLDVAGDDGRGIARVEQAAFGQHDRQRLEAAGVQRNVLADECAEHVQHGRAHDRRRRVEVAGARPAKFPRNPRSRARRSALMATATLIRSPPSSSTVKRPSRKARDRGAHACRGVVLHVPHVALDGANAEPLDEALELERRRARSPRAAL